jgi:putative ABC transport system substrate-binding protein
MRRREFISLVGGAAVAWPLAAAAQQSGGGRKVGVIMGYAEHDPAGETRFGALRNRLHELGWTEGRNIRFEVRWVTGNAERMHAYATELVYQPVDAIVVNSTPLLAATKQVTRTIPIIFAQVADPVGSGFVSSYARPGGNITGFADFDPSIAGKWVEVLKEALPSVGNVAVLMDPKQENHRTFLRAIGASALSLGVKVSAVEVRDRTEIDHALSAMSGQPDRGLIVLPGPVNNTLRTSIIELAARYRLPAIYPFKYYASEGGLLYYGIDQLDQWPKAATYVDRVLRGEKPSELPVQAPTSFELVVNLKAAKSLEFTISPTLLARADEVIE